MMDRTFHKVMMGMHMEMMLCHVLDNEIRIATDNILYGDLNRHRKPHLNLEKMKELNIQLQRHHKCWIDAAPTSYRSDRFLMQRTPIFIMSWYGQNQDIGMAFAEAQEDVENWEQDQDFRWIRFITIVIATHLRWMIMLGLN
jgi:hypothetical protein